MKYNANAPGGGVEASFEGRDEVEAVRRAFEENALRLTSLGNDSSISEYQKRVITWTGERQTYRGATSSQLVEPLRYFIEATEDMVDKLLDTRSQATRIQAAATRYKLGFKAGVILVEIEQQESGDAVGSVD